MGDEASAKKYLLKYFNASVVTQLPNIPGSPVKGIVKVKRTSTTVEGAKELTWTTHENLTNMINENNTEAQNYYAIDDNWNICVSTANTMQSGDEVTNTLREVSIPYQRLIGQYSMPFRFLFIMLQVTQNPEYVNYLCDMSSKGRQIDLMVFDSVQTSQNTVTHRYKEITKRLVEKLDENGMVQYTPFGEVMMEEIQEEEEKEETTVYTTKSNTITANVTYANTWLIEQRNEYINSQTTEYPLGEDGQEVLGDGEEVEGVEEVEEEEGIWRIPQSTMTKTEITKNAWTKSESEENNGTIKENEFLGLWKNETGKPELGAKYDPKGKLVYYKSLNGKQKRSPIQEILNNKLFLFQLLEQYEETQDYSTIMRYMLYKYTGKNYGVTKLNLDIFQQDDFYAISGNTGNRISYSSLNLTDEDLEILYKITYAERGNGTQEQQEYVASCVLNRVLSSKFPNTVRGVVFQKNQFQPTRNGAYDKAVPTETTKAAVQNVIQNGDTSQGSVYFMTVSSANTPEQQSWLKNCVFLFNDANGASNTHNFYTTQAVLAELEQYKSYSFSGEGSTIGVRCPRYYQSGQPWSGNPYNYKATGTISSGGCGACALAMAVSGLTGTEVTPNVIVDQLNAWRIYTVNNATACAQRIAAKYGLTYEYINRENKARVDAALDEGKVLIFSIVANGIYDNKGHFIMCVGRQGNNYYVLESGHYYETDRPYTFKQVFSPGNQGVFALGK